MFMVAAVALLVALGLAVARVISGPTVFDRMLAGNAVGTLAILLLAGRVLSAWYVDYQWFAIQGATRLWWIRAIDLALLRGTVFAIVALFAFANLFAVRRSIRSLRLPRRIGRIGSKRVGRGPTVPTRPGWPR